MQSDYHKAVWTPLHARIHRVLRQRSLLERNQRILVAVSGGQDSLCLIKLLLDLRSKWGWHLAIAHCDHGWRADSADNAAYVATLAQNWHIPFWGCTLEAERVQTSLSEAAAREWRYRMLTDIAQQQNYSCIVTGHTASDRAETLLYNLMRGSGADGLQALTWKRELAPSLSLVRPLLSVTRSETAQFCQDSELQAWIDSTNADVRYARNRIRQDVLPYLQMHFNPQIEQTLAQTAELLMAEVAYLEQQSDRLYQQALQPGSGCSNPINGHQTDRHQGDGEQTNETNSPSFASSSLNRTVLRSAPLALQRRVVRRFLIQRLVDAPNFEQIEKLVSLIDAPNRSQTDPFPGGAIARVDGQWIYLLQMN